MAYIYGIPPHFAPISVRWRVPEAGARETEFPVKILFASTEATPFAKTGGLADVVGALPLELARLGHETAIVMPAFRQVFASGLEIQPTEITFDIPIGSRVVSGKLLEGRLPESDVPVYFIEQSDYYDRAELYREGGEDYKDNCERFVFFCRAALETIREKSLGVEIVHCNDWQTGLIPAYLQTEYRAAPGYENIASVFTIHNLAYQGRFWHWDMLLTGLDWKYFNWRQMEFYGKLNLLKTGLVFSDALTTVSPTYAREIQTPEHGCGLDGVLRGREAVLTGILNGIDDSVWDPASDDNLLAHFSADDYASGKAECKKALQQEFNLPVEENTPLVAFIGRLADQKGLDLLVPLMRRWVEEMNAQWVVLATGEAEYQELLADLSRRYPQKISARLEFSNSVSHRIEAGADIFVMPSRYEPCGLNQLYSLRYGTVPVVRATGGLADTVHDATPENLAGGKANGFSFHEYNVFDFDAALRRAVEMYSHAPNDWKQLISTGMHEDNSWGASARRYEEVYKQTLARRREMQHA